MAGVDFEFGGAPGTAGEAGAAVPEAGPRKAPRRPREQHVSVGVFMACFGSFFCTTAANYLIRPVRESEALKLGTGAIPMLLGGTLVLPMFTAPLLGRLGQSSPRFSTAVLFRVYAVLFFSLGLAYVLLDSAWAGQSSRVPAAVPAGDAPAPSATPASRVALRVALFLLGDNASTSCLSFLFGVMPDLIGSGAFASRLYPLLGLACNLGQLLGSSVAASKALSGTGLIFLAVAFICGALQCIQHACDSGPAPSTCARPPAKTKAGGKASPPHKPHKPHKPQEGGRGRGRGRDRDHDCTHANANASAPKLELELGHEHAHEHEHADGHGGVRPGGGVGPGSSRKSRQNGLQLIIGSSFLRFLCTYSLIHAFTGTSLYVFRAHLMASSHMTTEEQMHYSALLSTSAAVLTITVQAFGAARMIPFFGGGSVLTFVPAITLVGFASVLLAPSVAFIGAVDVARRVANFGLSKPLRESLCV